MLHRNSRFSRYLPLMLLLVMLAIAGWSGLAYAAEDGGGDGTASPVADAATFLDGLSSDTEIAPGVNLRDVFAELESRTLTARVIATVKIVIIEVTQTLYREMYAILSAAIGAFMVLAVTVFGVKLTSGGVKNPLVDMSVLAIKLALVYEFTANMLSWVMSLFSVTEDLMTITSTALTGTNFSCPTELLDNAMTALATAGVTNPEFYTVWVHLDCAFLNFLGFAAVGAIASPIFGVFISLFVSGVLGANIAAAGMSAFVTMTFTILRVTYMFVASMVSLSFIIALAPMFVPMILFQVTNRYFEKWLKLLIAFTIQPAIMIAFVAFMVKVYDVVLFTGEFSVHAAMTGEPLPMNERFELEKFLEQVTCETAASEQVSSASSESAVDASVRAGFADLPLQVFGSTRGVDSVLNASNTITKCLDTLDPTTFVPSPTGDPFQDAMQAVGEMKEILMSFVLLGMITVCMYSMLQIVDTLVRYLSERSFRFNVSYALPMEKEVGQGIQAFAGGAQRGGLTLTPMMFVDRDAAGNPTDGLTATMNAYSAGATEGLTSVAASLPFGRGGYALLTGSALGQTQGGNNFEEGRYGEDIDNPDIGADGRQG